MKPEAAERIVEQVRRHRRVATSTILRAVEQMAADGPTRREQARRLAGMLQTLDQMPKVLLAEVQGPAFGGGVGLLSVCDIAVGVDGTRFALSETKLGLIPATIGPYVLARIGAAAALVAVPSA